MLMEQLDIRMQIFKDYFLERGEGREKERERHINVWLPLPCPPLGDLACNPGLCPDRELNQQPFGSQAGAQSTDTPARAIRKHFFKLKTLIHTKCKT